LLDGDKEKERLRSANRRKVKDEKSKARKILNDAVKKGLLVKPELCEKCHQGERVTGHHKNYAEPLAVEWLCYQCHAELRRAEVIR